MTLRPFVVPAMTAFLLLTGCRGDGGADSDAGGDTPAASGSGHVVTLDDASLKLIAIETVTIQHGKLDLKLRAPGRVTFDLNGTAKVTPMLGGRIEKMNVDVGAKVQKGDVVAVVDCAELLKPLELKAPVGGEIVARDGTVGELADPARELYMIGDPTNVWVIAEVNAADIAALHAGSPAVAYTSAYPGDTFPGTVTVVSPAIRERSRTVEVRIGVDNPQARLKPGMFVDVDIITGSLDDAVAIPEEAVQRLGEDTVVFVMTDANTFAARDVKTGPVQNGVVQILDGLTDGDRAVTRGSFVLKSELLKSEYGE